ncbi:hypothetical protein DI09_41p110 [Mitosporidium daphniae]|uniref:Zinc finger Sec23/Sec24-type domain-containing protein n=1 Tax=Mitosporidium daphniae TaxID=1485682 RepID=A0A098VQT6_9MICR|nr:uncharacterized protein DI09_41p110 [Mitosporidium daphniae]KGG51199.1 hypothetical protein DI09_41p110 [Mitosporidium daphniae]|eukprot:XP_013237626.1 uncharacterized protein DI09_41p110 [Mitosporidium daphniae]
MNTCDYSSNATEDEHPQGHPQQAAHSSQPNSYGFVGGNVPERTYPAEQWNDPPMLGDDENTGSHKISSLSSKYGRVSAQNSSSQSPQALYAKHQPPGAFQQQEYAQNVDPRTSFQSYSAQPPLQYPNHQPNFSSASIETPVSPSFSQHANTAAYQPQHDSTAAYQPQQQAHQQSQYATPYSSAYENFTAQPASSAYRSQHHSIAQQYSSNASPSILKLENVEVPGESVPLIPLTSCPSIQPSASPVFCRATIQALPASPAISKSIKIPLAVTFTPYPPITADPQTAFVPLVQGVILRCRRCRTYINPFVEWVDGSLRSYRCNLHAFDAVSFLVPLEYDYDSTSQRPIDRAGRFELSCPVVEYVAPDEYMVPSWVPLYVTVDQTPSA